MLVGETYVQESLQDVYVEALSIVQKSLPDYEHMREQVGSVRLNSRLTRVLGRCIYNRARKVNNIEIATRLYKLNDHKELLHTMIHELLHTYKDSHNHGPNWKKKADIIAKKTGIKIERIHSDIPGLKEVENEGKVKFCCNGCGQEIFKGPYSRFAKNYKWYSCGICGGKFVKA